MKPRFIKQEAEFMVIGISARTSNQEAMEKGTIQKLWQRFIDQEILLHIPHKISNSALALYYDYASDQHGQYTVLIGVQVSSLDDIPGGMTGVLVPATQREIFLSDLGDLSCIVFDLWQHIWKQEEMHQIQRAYTFDYEFYNQSSHNQGESIAEIHVSILK